MIYCNWLLANNQFRACYHWLKDTNKDNSKQHPGGCSTCLTAGDLQGHSAINSYKSSRVQACQWLPPFHHFNSALTFRLHGINTVCSVVVKALWEVWSSYTPHTSPTPASLHIHIPWHYCPPLVPDQHPYWLPNYNRTLPLSPSTAMSIQHRQTESMADITVCFSQCTSHIDRLTSLLGLWCRWYKPT